jgi:hypothetical protein
MLRTSVRMRWQRLARWNPHSSVPANKHQFAPVNCQEKDISSPHEDSSHSEKCFSHQFWSLKCLEETESSNPLAILFAMIYIIS